MGSAEAAGRPCAQRLSAARCAGPGEGRKDTYDVVDTTDDTSGQLGAERVPHTVFHLGGSRGTVLALGGLVDRDAAVIISAKSPRSCARVRLPFLAVDFNAGGNGAGKEVVLLATADKDTPANKVVSFCPSPHSVLPWFLLVTVRLDNHLGTAPGTTASAATASATRRTAAAPGSTTAAATAAAATTAVTETATATAATSTVTEAATAAAATSTVTTAATAATATEAAATTSFKAHVC